MTVEHAALRVSFAAGDAGPEQLVWDHVAPAVEVNDARGTGREGAASADQGRNPAAVRPRPPAAMAGPALPYRRVAVDRGLRRAPHHTRFLVAGPDAPELRRASGRTEETMKPDGDVFADHAGEQAARIADETTRSAWLGYWQKQLAGAPATLNLPLDRPRPALMTHSGDSLPFRLSALASEGVRRLARQARRYTLHVPAGGLSDPPEPLQRRAGRGGRFTGREPTEAAAACRAGQFRQYGGAAQPHRPGPQLSGPSGGGPRHGHRCVCAIRTALSPGWSSSWRRSAIPACRRSIRSGSPGNGYR